MKRFLVIFLSCIIMLTNLHFSVFAEEKNIYEEKLKELSQMNDEQCRQFLVDNEIEIPNELIDTDLSDVLKNIINDIDNILPINYAPIAKFDYNLKEAIKIYIGYEQPMRLSRDASSLQYSTLYSWNENTMKKYNCYGYVLGKTTSFYNPGEFCNQTYDGTKAMSIVDLANLVKMDLTTGLGYECVKVQSSRPSSKGKWSNAIAVKKDTQFGITYGGKKYNDYHFAKLSGSTWYHKPGGTAILKFKSAPNNSVAWTNECYNGNYIEGDITYNSSAMYILYKTSCNLDWYVTTTNYHQGIFHYYKWDYKCDDCGKIVSSEYRKVECSGPPCAAQFNSFQSVE